MSDATTSQGGLPSWHLGEPHPAGRWPSSDAVRGTRTSNLVQTDPTAVPPHEDVSGIPRLPAHRPPYCMRISAFPLPWQVSRQAWRVSARCQARFHGSWTALLRTQVRFSRSCREQRQSVTASPWNRPNLEGRPTCQAPCPDDGVLRSSVQTCSFWTTTGQCCSRARKSNVHGS